MRNFTNYFNLRLLPRCVGTILSWDLSKNDGPNFFRDFYRAKGTLSFSQSMSNLAINMTNRYHIRTVII